jgi:hypothetical protein
MTESTSRLPPESPQQPSGGNLLLQRFGGGDSMYGYGCPAQEWIAEFGHRDVLVCHHSAQTKSDFYKQLQAEAIFAFFLYGVLGTIVVGFLGSFGLRSDEFKSSVRVLLPLIAIGAALYNVYKYIELHPNPVWERKKWIDIPSRTFCISHETYGKKPSKKSMCIPLDELAFVAWENHYWEGTPSYDVSLARKEAVDEALKTGRDPEVLCNLYMGDSMQGASEVAAHLQAQVSIQLALMTPKAGGGFKLRWGQIQNM